MHAKNDGKKCLYIHCVCLNYYLSGHETFTYGLELVENLVMWFHSNLISVMFYTFLHSECSEATKSCLQEAAYFQVRSLEIKST